MSEAFEPHSVTQVVAMSGAMIRDIPLAIRQSASDGWRSVAIMLAVIVLGLFVVIPTWTAWHVVRLSWAAIADRRT